MCDYLRKTTQQKGYQDKYKDKPSDEIQLLLRILTGLNKFSGEKQESKQFNPVCLNLFGAYLVGAKLENACLNRADLSGTNMREAHLSRAQLRWAQLQKALLQKAEMQGAILKNAEMREAILKNAKMEEAQMQKAVLHKAQMQGAVLQKAQMQGAKLGGAQMQDADLLQAQMQGAALPGTQMQGAFLTMAQMQGADLFDAQMQGAILWEAQMQVARLSMTQLQGANLWRAQMQGADVTLKQALGPSSAAVVDLRGAECHLPDGPLKILRDRIGERIDKQAELETVIFSGGLKAEDVQRIRDQLTECQKNGWMSEEVVEEIINEISEKHQGPLSHQLSEDCATMKLTANRIFIGHGLFKGGVGSYTKEEAKAILDEHKDAIDGVEEYDLDLRFLRHLIIVQNKG